MDVVVVGGSLAGLTVALRLSREGHRVTVLERDTRVGLGAAGIGVDRRTLAAVTGDDPRTGPDALPVITTSRDSTGWHQLRDWLAARCGARENIDVRLASEVTDVDLSSASVTVDGQRIVADVVVGADGYRSVVRREVCPDAPDARFAGYGLWRGMASEAQFAPERRMRGLERGLLVESAGPYRLVAYHVPGEDGSTHPGSRRISWAWYTARSNRLLEELGCIADGRVRRTLTGSRVPDDTVAELHALARRLWRDPWAAAIQQSIEDRSFINTPVAEYRPSRLARESAALIGDAAHVASPMTGHGFHYAMLDADALGRALSGEAPDAVPDALRRYERERLAPDQDLADDGAAWGRMYLAGQV